MKPCEFSNAFFKVIVIIGFSLSRKRNYLINIIKISDGNEILLVGLKLL
ncbi:hypothetical protein DDD_3026 [Nonlabens dokdonensis DSW-6]|uniref:Uncharacterized protein n=1 Tax=Nonlabens dokdonensis (strain DSM 17205 / KCTC 12402 / DSW-6) TaxID=592029 RepID=L7WGS7_NONDD|nr:hypothetical protein DDD_3026 [Nonlabens dokdonensis DSW-6]